MRIIGIDPGFAIVGFAVLEYARGDFGVIDYAAITTKAATPFALRLREIYSDICFVLDKYEPEALAIEQLFFTTNRTTAIAVAEARGIILLAAANRDIPIAEYTPLQVKSAVSGYGKATKKQVQDMTRRILNLAAVPQPDDVADALAIAICHAHNAGRLQQKIHKN